MTKVYITESGYKLNVASTLRMTASEAETLLDGVFEPVLGNPGTNGYVLSSTTGGTRSWVAQSGGGGASDVGNLTTTTGSSTNMLRVAAAGGLEYRTTAQVLGDIGAAPTASPTFTGTVTAPTIVGGVIKPSSDSTTALQLANAAGTAVLTVDTATPSLGVGITPNYKLHVVGSKGTVGVGVTGSFAPEDTLFYASTAAVNGYIRGFLITASASAGLEQTFFNTNSTSPSASTKFEVATTGAGGGDPKFVYTISGVLNWCIGVDNSNSDMLCFSTSDSPGNNDALRISTSGIVDFAATMGNSTRVVGVDAPADWVEIQIGGTTYYLPAYAA